MGGVCEPVCMCVCVCVCVCMRGGGACLCERNRAAEQVVSPVRCSVKHTRCPQGWVSWPLHVTGSEIIIHLPASLWLLSPISPAPLCLLPCLPSTGLCERLCLLASPVPTRCPLGSREACIQERGPLVCSVQFSSVAHWCLTLRSHGPQHARPSCPSPTPGVYPNSCPLSR